MSKTEKEHHSFFSSFQQKKKKRNKLMIYYRVICMNILQVDCKSINVIPLNRQKSNFKREHMGFFLFQSASKF